MNFVDTARVLPLRALGCLHSCIIFIHIWKYESIHVLLAHAFHYLSTNNAPADRSLEYACLKINLYALRVLDIRRLAEFSPEGHS